MRTYVILLILVSSGMGSQTAHKSSNDKPILHQNLFERMQNEDVVTLNYSSSGCFHFSAEKIVFSKKDNLIKAQIFIKDKLIQSKVLTAEKLSYLIDFEQKVRQMNKNTGCTNSETYAFLLNNAPQFVTVDSTCSWNGYESLKKQLFNIS